MTEKFADILQFCSHVSKLMVTEIRRRASNQSTGMITFPDTITAIYGNQPERPIICMRIGSNRLILRIILFNNKNLINFT